jgi:hypothetical protein
LADLFFAPAFGFTARSKSLVSFDLILPALFSCITFFFAAESAKEIARLMVSGVFACRKAASNLLIIKELTLAFRLETLSARLAVFVTGMRQV